MGEVALVVSEPVRERMAGIGVRYLEMARRLPLYGLKTRLVAPKAEGSLESIEACDGTEVPVLEFLPGRLPQLTQGCTCVVTQGQVGNDVVLELQDLPVVIDLYDPWLVEHLHYHESLGLDPYRNDHATWLLQMSRGDFFLCSSAEQRLYYLGLLTALGRVNPMSAPAGNVEKMIAVVPFGLDEQVPVGETYLPARNTNECRLFFGGLYDWYDPLTVLNALETVQKNVGRPVELLFVASPNPGSTPQKKLELVKANLDRFSPSRNKIEIKILDPVPYERRFDILRDVDVLVTAHQPGLETDLSLRTRFLDALVAGCPVVVAEGGALGRILGEFDSGWLFPSGDSERLAEALTQVVTGGSLVDDRVARGESLAATFQWDLVLDPLIEFCRNPSQDATKRDFVHGLATTSPSDPLAFRIKRWLRGRL